jgi:hypothetical protein
MISTYTHISIHHYTHVQDITLYTASKLNRIFQRVDTALYT